MPKAPSDVRSHPRQRPISCRFCRLRKLRCSREAPCSNCVSRDIQCDLEQHVVRSRGHSQPSPQESVNSTTEAELLERIRVLEKRIKEQSSQTRPAAKIEHNTKVIAHLSTPESLHDVTQELPATKDGASLDDLDNDAAWLETLYSGQNFARSRPFDRMSFRVCPVQYMRHADSVTGQGPRRVQFPSISEATILVEKYIQHVNHTHHTIHVPSLRIAVDELYACLARQGAVPPGKAALVLAVLASGAYCSVRSEGAVGPFTAPGDGHKQALIWVRDVEDIIDMAHRTTQVSIEACQALIVASFVIADSEGISMRFRSHLSLALLLARRLGLHKMDCADTQKQSDAVLAETGRCVWWYIVATDWIMSQRLAGADRGVYNCNPRQMTVMKPLNIDDEDLSAFGPSAAKPMSWPTCKSYTLQRIRLAEITRKVSDRAALYTDWSGDVAYEGVLEIDLELQQMINEMPLYFRQTVPELMEAYNLDRPRASKIRQQGHLIQSHVYSQRSVLHFPWFLRSHFNRTYASSRDICLSCAREAIRMEIEFDKEGLYTSAQYKFVCVLMSLFRATVILLVDLCRSSIPNSPSAISRSRLTKDIAEAFHLMDNARLASETSNKFLDSISAVLRKYCIPSVRGNRKQDDLAVSSESQPSLPGHNKSADTCSSGISGKLGNDLPIKHGHPESQLDGIVPATSGGIGGRALFDQATTRSHHCISSTAGANSADILFSDFGNFAEASLSPGTFSYDLNEFAATLESNTVGFKDLTWNDIFSEWDSV